MEILYYTISVEDLAAFPDMYIFFSSLLKELLNVIFFLNTAFCIRVCMTCFKIFVYFLSSDRCYTRVLSSIFE